MLAKSDINNSFKIIRDDKHLNCFHKATYFSQLWTDTAAILNFAITSSHFEILFGHLNF